MSSHVLTVEGLMALQSLAAALNTVFQPFQSFRYDVVRSTIFLVVHTANHAIYSPSIGR